jgi:hypothetical protein
MIPQNYNRSTIVAMEHNVDNMKRQGLSAKPYQPAQMMNSSTQYNSATQPCCFIFDVMGWRLIL